ncbi:MAG: tautomerase family protein [Bryobacterales bacterium]
MPHAHSRHYAVFRRTYDKKAKLIQEVTDATVRALDVTPESVRVILREVHPSHFAGRRAQRLAEE